MINYDEIKKNCPDESGKTTYCIHKDCDMGRPDHKARLWVKNCGDHAVAYCHNCGNKGYVQFKRKARYKKVQALNVSKDILLPNDFTETIPVEYLVWLYKYHLTDQVINHYGFGWSPQMQRIILPVYTTEGLRFWQGRAVHKNQDPKYITFRGNKKELFFSNTNTSNTIILCEDYLSAIRVGEVTNSCALFGTHMDDDNILHLQRKYANIILWLDGDRAGRKSSIKLKKKLSTPINQITNIRTELDPKEYTKDQIKKRVHIRIGE